jgi:hypothetical protein
MATTEDFTAVAEQFVREAFATGKAAGVKEGYMNAARLLMERADATTKHGETLSDPDARLRCSDSARVVMAIAGTLLEMSK